MRLASLTTALGPRLAIQADDGTYRDLTRVDPGLGPDVFALLRSGDDWAERARAAALRAAPIEGASVFRPAVPAPGKMLCLGLNDAEHAEEGGFPIPEHPEVFARVASSLIGHRQPMLRPRESEKLDYEVELAVVLGRGGRRIPAERALDHVAGYTVFNDGTVRDYQKRTKQWTLGKNFHGTGALGPALVTADELPRGAAGLRMTTDVGEERLQDGSTGAMIFDVPRTIAILSEAVTFEPGDVIAMGTTAGVGHARRPPRWLRPGEEVRVEVEGVGVLVNPVVADDDTPASAAGGSTADRGR